MELQSFNQFLTAAVKAGASDIHLKAGSPPAVRVSGELRTVRMPSLRPEDTLAIVGHILGAARWKGRLEDVADVDSSYALEGVGRFRAAVFRQKGVLAAILRAIPFAVPTLEQLGLPPVLEKIAAADRGLILVTGITGSGKTSTLAAIVDHINQTTRKHVLTIEDPIEFLHEDKTARITQREVGPDTPTFATALRAALRQDPDVILVGELRDHETIDIALKAAETGHLVLSTAHTSDAVRTVNRLVGVYPNEAQVGVRNLLAELLQAVLCQRLLPRADGRGRALALEILIGTMTVQEYIRDPAKIGLIPELLDSGHEMYGTQTFDRHLSELVQRGIVSAEVARDNATNAGDFERAMAFE